MRSPAGVFVAGILLLVGGGTAVLCRPECVIRDERNVQHFAERHIWERAFDAVSAACGAGLLSADLNAAYTPTGRWVLLGIGLIGALFYVAAGAAATHCLLLADAAPAPPVVAVGATFNPAPRASRWESAALRESGPVSVQRAPAPPILTICLLFLGVQALATLAIWGLGRWFCPTVGIEETAWLAGTSFASVGLIPPPADFEQAQADFGTAQMLAVVGWLGALGWPIWLFLLPPLRRRFVARGAALKMVLGYAAFVAAAAGAIFLLESPRGGIDIASRGAASDAPEPALSRQTPEMRFSRSLVAAVCASSAGIATEPLGDRGLRDSSKAVLALLLLVGGLGGSATGGMKWPLLLRALAGRASPTLRRAAASCVLWTLLLTTITAAGLLLLESQVATKYQSAPTFADALLDAGSAVAGGNLTSGLTATVTSRNLVSGIWLGVNWYRVGMVWLVAAMLIGRAVPIVVLSRAGRSVAVKVAGAGGYA